MSREDYEVVMGLEVHAELSTKTKIFCSCPTKFGAKPNSQTCPICMAMPGTLPVLNKWWKKEDSFNKNSYRRRCW